MNFWLRRTRFLISYRDFQRFLRSDWPLAGYHDNLNQNIINHGFIITRFSQWLVFLSTTRPSTACGDSFTVRLLIIFQSSYHISAYSSGLIRTSFLNPATLLIFVPYWPLPKHVIVVVVRSELAKVEKRNNFCNLKVQKVTIEIRNKKKQTVDIFSYLSYLNLEELPKVQTWSSYLEIGREVHWSGILYLVDICCHRVHAKKWTTWHDKRRCPGGSYDNNEYHITIWMLWCCTSSGTWDCARLFEIKSAELYKKLEGNGIFSHIFPTSKC